MSTYVGYVYRTRCLANHKSYIGLHRESKFNPGYIGSGKLLKRALTKYGKESFAVEVLEWCSTEDELLNAEKKWIKTYNAVEDPDFYNISHGGPSAILTGEANPHFGKFGANHARGGKKNTAKHNQAISDYMKNRVVSEETRAKMSAARKGLNPNKGFVFKEVRVCPHCGKEGRGGIMLHWHFDNCKHAQNIQEQVHSA